MNEAVAFMVPTAASRIVADHVAAYGRRRIGVETGGFLLAPVGSAVVDTVAVTGVEGIARRPDQFHISGPAIEALTEWAEEHDRRVVAQFHSHQFGAFLSPIDRVSGFRVGGFTTTVVPDFVDPCPDPSTGGWWRYRGGDWQPASPPVTATVGTAEMRVFDAAGVQ